MPSKYSKRPVRSKKKKPKPNYTQKIGSPKKSKNNRAKSVKPSYQPATMPVSNINLVEREDEDMNLLFWTDTKDIDPQYLRRLKSYEQQTSNYSFPSVTQSVCFGRYKEQEQKQHELGSMLGKGLDMLSARVLVSQLNCADLECIADSDYHNSLLYLNERLLAKNQLLPADLTESILVKGESYLIFGCSYCNKLEIVTFEGFCEMLLALSEHEWYGSQTTLYLQEGDFSDASGDDSLLEIETFSHSCFGFQVLDSNWYRDQAKYVIR